MRVRGREGERGGEKEREKESRAHPREEVQDAIAWPRASRESRILPSSLSLSYSRCVSLFSRGIKRNVHLYTFPHKRRLNGRFRVHETAKRTSLLFRSVLDCLTPLSYPSLSAHLSPSPLCSRLFSIVFTFFFFVVFCSFAFLFLQISHRYSTLCESNFTESRPRDRAYHGNNGLSGLFEKLLADFFRGKHSRGQSRNERERSLCRVKSGFFNAPPFKAAFVACSKRWMSGVVVSTPSVGEITFSTENKDVSRVCPGTLKISPYYSCEVFRVRVKNWFTKFFRLFRFWVSLKLEESFRKPTESLIHSNVPVLLLEGWFYA